MKKIFFLILLAINGVAFSQSSIIQNDSLRMRNIEEKIKINDENISQIRASIEKNEKLSTENFSSYKSDTKDLLNLYVFFLTAVILILGFLINFFGKTAIKNRVEELITETAQNHIERKIVETLNSKLTNELIQKAIENKSEAQINKIIGALEEKGNSAINEIVSKGDKAIKTMLTLPPKHQIVHTENLTDSEITNQNNSLRADEFYNLAFNSKDPRTQIELYKNVVEIESNNLGALNNMAVGHINLNEPEAAIDLLNKVISLDPEYYTAYANRAQAYNLQDKFEEALKDVERTISIKKDFEYAYAVKGNVLTKQGDFYNAEISLNTAIRYNENSAEAYFNRAFFYEERGEYAKSLQDYNKAEQLGFPNKAMLYNNMAVLHRRLKELDLAVELVEKARLFNPNFPNIDGTLALIYADKSDHENFYKYLTIALQKGCQAWRYLNDPGFDNYRESKRLKMLITPYKKKFFS